jgi:hypothetical protein
MAKITIKPAIKIKEDDKKSGNDNDSSNNVIKIQDNLRKHMTDLEQIFFIHGNSVTSKLGSDKLVNKKLDDVED